MTGDGLRLTGFAHHEELGENGDTFQVDGEGPQDLHHGKLVVQHESEDGAWSKEKLNPEINTLFCEIVYLPLCIYITPNL